MKRLYLITLTVLCSLPIVSFANLNDELLAMDKVAKEQVSSISQDTLNSLQGRAMQNKEQNIAFINKLLRNTREGIGQKKGGKPADGAMLFISFSMPEQMILSLADEAAYFGIPVVLKGLVSGDFKQTLQKIAYLQKKAKKEGYRFEGLSIDPVWFEQFDITSVPAVVVTKRPLECEYQQMCKNQPFDVVFGNVSIKKSLEIIAEKGEEVPDAAKKILGGEND